MKTINTYILEKLHLKQGMQNIDVKFTSDMKKLLKLVKDNMGSNDHIEIIYDMCLTDEDYNIIGYEFNESKFRSLLYSIVNYDLISLYGKKIDIKNSNHPDIARIMKRYATKEMVENVYNSLFIR